MVLLLNHGEQTIVLKAKRPYWTDYEPLFIPMDPVSNVGKVEDFWRVLVDSLHYNQGISLIGNERVILSTLFPQQVESMLNKDLLNDKQRKAGIVISSKNVFLWSAQKCELDMFNNIFIFSCSDA